MNQVSARIVNEPERILGELERPHARNFKRAQSRNISGSWIVWLRCPDIARGAKPGQFVMVRCGGECLLPRPFSIHQVNDGNIALFFAVWEGGKGTNWLSQRHKDDTVELLGPLGNGFSINPASQNLLLVAGGIGIAPLRFLADKAIEEGKKVTLLLGAQTASQLYPEHLLPSDIELITATEDGSSLRRMVVTVLLSDFINWADQVFACGPMPMYHDIYAKREDLLKDKPVQVSLEVRMGCGLGICYGCTVKTKQGLKQVCRDGPVFHLDDILWDELNW